MNQTRERQILDHLYGTGGKIVVLDGRMGTANDRDPGWPGESLEGVWIGPGLMPGYWPKKGELIITPHEAAALEKCRLIIRVYGTVNTSAPGRDYWNSLPPPDGADA
jgi:hypothetical protein